MAWELVLELAEIAYHATCLVHQVSFAVIMGGKTNLKLGPRFELQTRGVLVAFLEQGGNNYRVGVAPIKFV